MTQHNNLHNLEDAQLVSMTLSDNREAFGVLYDRYAKWVQAVTYSTFGFRDGLQDIIQETFLRAYKDLEELDEPAKFDSWIAGIARFVAFEKMRKKSRDRYESLEDIAGMNAPEKLFQQEEVQLVLQELNQLSEIERLAIHTFYLQGKNVETTAQHLRMSRSGVYAVLERGCRKIAQRLRPLGSGKENR